MEVLNNVMQPNFVLYKSNWLEHAISMLSTIVNTLTTTDQSEAEDLNEHCRDYYRTVTDLHASRSEENRTMLQQEERSPGE
jgi:hemerythrin superfamily protein